MNFVQARSNCSRCRLPVLRLFLTIALPCAQRNLILLSVLG